jgi:predicted transcriptional regulator
MSKRREDSAMKNTLLIAIRSVEQLEQETLAALKKAEVGMPGEEPINRLYFADHNTLFSALSPKRWELLRLLRKQGPMSIKKLAAALKRDYKNVYDDVKQLSKLDLIEKQKDERFYVPWDDITIQLALAA